MIFNLGLLAYYKYANFLVGGINNLFNAGFNLTKIALPLAISFFTFQKISYLVNPTVETTSSTACWSTFCM